MPGRAGGPHAFASYRRRCAPDRRAALWLFRPRLRNPPRPAARLEVVDAHTQLSFHALRYGTSADSPLKDALPLVARDCHVGGVVVDKGFFCLGAEYHLFIEPARDIAVETIDAVLGAYVRAR